tara:strand:- start:11 stop:484 length:474 start_codon:yes stop_codon:yes gene_type:complete
MLGEIYYEEFIARMQREPKCHISYDGLKDLFFHLDEQKDKWGNPIELTLNDETVNDLIHSWEHWESVEDWFEANGDSYLDALVKHDSTDCDMQGFTVGDPCPAEDGTLFHLDEIDSWDNAMSLTGDNRLIETAHGALERVSIISIDMPLPSELWNKR